VGKDSMNRVSKASPCPVCGRPDWCLVAADGSVAICQRVADGAVKKTNAGWLHRLNEPHGVPSSGRLQRGSSSGTPSLPLKGYSTVQGAIEATAKSIGGRPVHEWVYHWPDKSEAF